MKLDLQEKLWPEATALAFRKIICRPFSQIGYV